MLVARAFLTFSFSHIHSTPTPLQGCLFISFLEIVQYVRRDFKKNGWYLPISTYYAISRTPPYIPEPLHLPIGN
jgi:hypothetical protein